MRQGRELLGIRVLPASRGAACVEDVIQGEWVSKWVLTGGMDALTPHPPPTPALREIMIRAKPVSRLSKSPPVASLSILTWDLYVKHYMTNQYLLNEQPVRSRHPICGRWIKNNSWCHGFVASPSHLGSNWAANSQYGCLRTLLGTM